MTPNTSHGVETMSKREEVIEAMARALCWRTNGQFLDCTSKCLSANECHGEMDRDDLDRASVAFDAAIKVLMEPDEAMRRVGEAEMSARHPNLDSFRDPYVDSTWKAMLKAASA